MLHRTPPGWIVLAGLCLAAAALPARALDAESGAVVVKLKPYALVHERQYALGEIADISGGDADAVRRLASLALGGSPRLGYTEQLARAQVQRVVRTYVGELYERLVWEGAKVLKLETAAVAYDGGRIVEAASAHLRDALSRRYAQLEIHPAEAPPRLDLPAGEVTLRPREDAAMGPPRSRMPVWVDVSIDGAFYRTVIVPLRVEIPGTALFARKNLPRGAVPAPEDFEPRQVDLAALGAEAAVPASAFGKHLSRPLAAGDPLLSSSLEERLAVNKGDVVTLLVRAGAIEIESRATALSGGVVGQKVRIKPAAGDAVVVAEIVSPNVVQLLAR